MSDEAWLLLRCPNCDHRFEHDPNNLSFSNNKVRCPGCMQDFAVRVTFVVEKISSIVPPTP